MSTIRDVTAMWVDKDGIHLAIPLDAIVQFILKPFNDVGLNPTIEVDAVRNRIKINIGSNDVKKLIASASANNPALMNQLIQIMRMAEEMDNAINKGNK